MLTKFFGAQELGRQSLKVGHAFPTTNFNVTKVVDILNLCDELEVRFKSFAKHRGLAKALSDRRHRIARCVDGACSL